MLAQQPWRIQTAATHRNLLQIATQRTRLVTACSAVQQKTHDTKLCVKTLRVTASGHDVTTAVDMIATKHCMRAGVLVELPQLN
jgi:hypothetical protein